MASYRRSLIFRLACDPVSRLWSGAGDLDLPPNDRDAETERYRGAGELLAIPALKQLLNGTAERYDISVSGVSTETLRYLHEDRESVKNAAVDIGWVLFDDAWQVDEIIWRWRGTADVPSVESVEIENGRQRTITLSVRQNDTFRSNPQPAYWTDQDQRRRSPTDAIFSHVAIISQKATRTFAPDSD